MSETRSGWQTSAQIGRMGAIETLQSGDFSLPDGQCFNLKNESTTPVELAVQLAGMPEGEFITTTFTRGWNPEIVRVIKQTAESTNLKWGY